MSIRSVSAFHRTFSDNNYDGDGDDADDIVVVVVAFDVSADCYSAFKIDCV